MGVRDLLFLFGRWVPCPFAPRCPCHSERSEEPVFSLGGGATVPTLAQLPPPPPLSLLPSIGHQNGGPIEVLFV